MQSSFLSEYLGDVDGKRLGATLLAAFFSVLGLVAIAILMRRSTTPLPELDREYLKFCRSLEKQGLGRSIGEGPLSYAKRIGKERPDLMEMVDEVTRLYVDSSYKTDTQVDLKVIKRAIRTVRLKVLT
jgi:hypothetical protein